MSFIIQNVLPVWKNISQIWVSRTKLQSVCSLVLETRELTNIVVHSAVDVFVD